MVEWRANMTLWQDSYMCMSHVTHINESCHTYQWVLSHLGMSLVTLWHICHVMTYKFMSHTWMHYVMSTYMSERMPSNIMTRMSHTCIRMTLWHVVSTWHYDTCRIHVWDIRIEYMCETFESHTCVTRVIMSCEYMCETFESFPCVTCHVGSLLLPFFVWLIDTHKI